VPGQRREVEQELLLPLAVLAEQQAVVTPEHDQGAIASLRRSGVSSSRPPRIHEADSGVEGADAVLEVLLAQPVIVRPDVAGDVRQRLLGSGFTPSSEKAMKVRIGRPLRAGLTRESPAYRQDFRQKARAANPSAAKVNKPGSGMVTTNAWMPWLELMA
jgi:hypothetical protein